MANLYTNLHPLKAYHTAVRRPKEGQESKKKITYKHQSERQIGDDEYARSLIEKELKDL